MSDPLVFADILPSAFISSVNGIANHLSRVSIINLWAVEYAI